MPCVIEMKDEEAEEGDILSLQPSPCLLGTVTEQPEYKGSRDKNVVSMESPIRYCTARSADYVPMVSPDRSPEERTQLRSDRNSADRRSEMIVLSGLRRTMRRMSLQIQQFASCPEDGSQLCGSRCSDPVTGRGGVVDDASMASSPQSASSHYSVTSSQHWDDNDWSLWLLEHDAETAAAWSSLENAVSMLQEHTRLADEEASQAQDLHVRVEAWKERAQKAESELERVQLQNTQLSIQVQRLSKERRVLVKEVKSVRERLEVAEQKDVWRQVENYVVRALSVHEAQLHKKNPSTSVGNESVGAISSCASTQEHEDGDFTVASTTATKLEAKNGEIKNVEAASQESPQQVMPLAVEPKAESVRSELPVRPSVGFGGGVALGFGKNFALKASQPARPNHATLPLSSLQSKSSKPLGSDIPDPFPTMQEKSLTKPTTMGTERLTLSNRVQRSRVNSAEAFGSTFKKLMLSGTHGIASVISGRTSPTTGELPAHPAPEGDSLVDGFTRPRDDSHDFSIVTTDDASAPAPTPLSFQSPWIPGHIVATTGLSKDLVSQLGSPLLLTPSESPASLGRYDTPNAIELDCDPLILRSLSIPIVHEPRKKKQSMSCYESSSSNKPL